MCILPNQCNVYFFGCDRKKTHFLWSISNKKMRYWSDGLLTYSEFNFSFYSWNNSRKLRLLFGFFVYIQTHTHTYLCMFYIFTYKQKIHLFLRSYFYLLENRGRYTNKSISIYIFDTLRTFLRAIFCLDLYHIPLLIFTYWADKQCQLF